MKFPPDSDDILYRGEFWSDPNNLKEEIIMGKGAFPVGHGDSMWRKPAGALPLGHGDAMFRKATGALPSGHGNCFRSPSSAVKGSVFDTVEHSIPLDQILNSIDMTGGMAVRFGKKELNDLKPIDLTGGVAVRFGGKAPEITSVSYLGMRLEERLSLANVVPLHKIVLELSPMQQLDAIKAVLSVAARRNMEVVFILHKPGNGIAEFAKELGKDLKCTVVAAGNWDEVYGHRSTHSELLKNKQPGEALIVIVSSETLPWNYQLGPMRI